MSFQKENPGYKEKSMETATKVDEVLFDTPVNPDVVSMMAKNTREKLILLGKLAEQIENEKI